MNYADRLSAVLYTAESSVEGLLHQFKNNTELYNGFDFFADQKIFSSKIVCWISASVVDGLISCERSSSKTFGL